MDDDQCKQTPDKGESVQMPSNCEGSENVILTESEIKQEPIVKEEPFDYMDDNVLVVPAPIVWSIGNLVDVTLEASAQKMHKDAFMLINKNNGKDEAMNPTLNKFKSNQKKLVTAKAAEKQHKCTSCDYAAPCKSKLERHNRKHTGEKPFPCTHCPKRFRTKQDLQSHMRTHADEFLFSCSNCLKGFDQSNEKLEHEATCNVCRYECDVCKKYSTLYKTHLIRHMLVHSDEKQFKCELCSKTFHQKSNLYRHKKIHK